jgi:hypothetical protein
MLYAPYDPLRYNKISACRNRKSGCTITTLWVVILRTEGARVLEILESVMMKIMIMMMVNYCSGIMMMMKIMMIIMMLNYRACPVLGQPDNYSKNINFFLVTISKILRSCWMGHIVFWYMNINVSEKPASSVIMEEEISQ